MKYLALLLVLLACSKPAPKQVTDGYAPLVCVPVKPYSVQATAIHRRRRATQICKWASDYTVVDGKFVPRDTTGAAR